MLDRFATLEVVKAGEVTVVSFGEHEVLDQVNIAACRTQIENLIQQNHAKTVAFNLTGVRFIPSGMLGLLASVRDLGVTVQIFNPSDDVREVLEITKLNRLIEVHEVSP